VRDLPLLKTPEGAILVSQRSGIRGMSVQMAEVAVPRGMFADILSLIAARAGMTGDRVGCDGRRLQKYALMKAKRRVPTLRGRASRHSRCHRVGYDSNFVATHLGQTEDRAQQPGVSGDVGLETFAVTKRTNKSGAAGTLLHLVFFGLVAVVTVISFGFASFSLLCNSREMLVSSRIGKAAIEFGYPHAAVVPYTEDHAAPAAAVADPPSSVGANLPLAQVVSASPNASPNPFAGAPIPGEEGDQLFRAFQILHSQPPMLDQGAIASQQTTTAQPMQSRRPDGHPVSSKAALQYRMRKECGPIHDPQLRHSCISTFGSLRSPHVSAGAKIPQQRPGSPVAPE
jgi:hypothetical protein